MSYNRKLHDAKTNKRDEFYTRYDTIDMEMKEYLRFNPDVFKDKTILLPCDNPKESQFTKYFIDNFYAFGLKKLISTCYVPRPEIDLFAIMDKSKDDLLLDEPPIPSGFHIEMTQTTYKQQLLISDGDFNSDEVTRFRDEADIIITNPPFSKFRQFIRWIHEAEDEKQFIILGPISAISYKEVFPYIMADKMWCGATAFNKGMYFYVPDDYEFSPSYMGRIEIDGRKSMRVPGVCWFTNIEHSRRFKKVNTITVEYDKSGNPLQMYTDIPYRRYDNYDAIDIPTYTSIPTGYKGLMGIPITFLNHYCPDQFEIVGITDRGSGDMSLRTKIYTEEDDPKFNDLNACSVIKDDSGRLHITYSRLLIRYREQPE